MENDIQKLYDVLSRDGYYTKSFDEFTKQFEDDSYKQKVYDVTNRDGLYTKSYEEFTSKYSLKKKDFSEASTSGLEPGVSVSGETDDIFKNDYLLSLRDGSIKKDSGELYTNADVIKYAQEYGYPKEDIEKMMIKTSSDPSLNSSLISSKDYIKEPEVKVEEEEPQEVKVPSDLEEKIYQSIYGKSLEQGDTSVPTMEQWKENPDLYSASSPEEANKEAFNMMFDPEIGNQAVINVLKTTVIPALKNVENAYDDLFIGDAIRTISMGTNKELKQLQIDKKKEKIQSDTTLTEEQKENKIQELSADGFVWASEPFANFTGYTPEETNEFAVGIMSTIGDYMLTPAVGLLGQASKLGAKVLTSKILLKTGKATQEVLTKLFKMSPDVASRTVQKQLPEFLRRVDIAGTKFGTLNIYKDFQQQVDEYGGIENIDFSQSEEAFTEGYSTGVLLGTVGSVSRALPGVAQAVKDVGVKGVMKEGVKGVLNKMPYDKSVLIGRLAEGLSFTTEVGTFGLINATTPTLENPKGELTTESAIDGLSEALKVVIGFRVAGIAQNLMKPKFKLDLKDKTENQKASDLVKEIDLKIKEGNFNPKEYLKDVIEKGKAPISVIDKVLQEVSGMKSNLTRNNIAKKVFKIEVQAKSDGTFDLNTYNKEGNWLTTRYISNIGEARESIESFNQERLEAPQGTYEPNVEILMNLDPIEVVTGKVAESQEFDIDIPTTYRGPDWDIEAKKLLPDSKFESQEKLESTINSESWGMLTAENPNAEQVSDIANQANNEKALGWLKSRGYEPQPIFGKYDNSELSYFVPELSNKDAVEFAVEFNQQSVATDKGLIYQDGSYNPIEKGGLSFDVGSDFYSTIKINGEEVDFSIEYDINQKIGGSQAPVEAELGELEFYRAGKTDPKDLDPAMAKDYANAVFLSKDKGFVEAWDKNQKYGEGNIKKIKVDINKPFDTEDPATWGLALDKGIFTEKELKDFNEKKVETIVTMEADTDVGTPEVTETKDLGKDNWLFIEQRANELQEAGYDSFYVYEKGARNVGVFNKGVYSEVTEAPVSETTTDVPEIKIPETRYNDPKRIEEVGFETGGVAHIPTDFMLNFLHVGEKRIKQYAGEEIDLEIKELKEWLESSGKSVSKKIQYLPNRLEATRMIANSIRKDGFTGDEDNIHEGPILLQVDSRGFARIGQGNHRLLAAKALGMDKVPVKVQFSEFYDNTPRVNKIKVISDSKIEELESIAKKEDTKLNMLVFGLQI